MVLMLPHVCCVLSPESFNSWDPFPLFKHLFLIHFCVMRLPLEVPVSSTVDFSVRQLHTSSLIAFYIGFVC